MGPSARKFRPSRGHQHVQAVALSGDGKHVLTGSGQTAVLWDAASGKKIQTFEGHPDTVTSAAMSRDGKLVVTGAAGNKATLWDAASGKKLKTFEGHTDRYWRGPERRRQAVLTGSNDKTAILWDAASGKKIQTFQGHTAAHERGPERRRQTRPHRVARRDSDPVGRGQRPENPHLPGTLTLSTRWP